MDSDLIRKRIKFAGDVHKELLKAGWDLETATNFVNSIPDADAVEVVHGTCETDGEHGEWYSPILICKECGEAFMTYSDTANYCPDCGAKFDAGIQKYKIIKICKATDRRCKNCKRGSCVYRKEVKRWVK